MRAQEKALSVNFGGCFWWVSSWSEPYSLGSISGPMVVGNSHIWLLSVSRAPKKASSPLSPRRQVPPLSKMNQHNFVGLRNLEAKR